MTGAARNRSVNCQHLEDARVDPQIDGSQHVKRQIRETAPAFLRCFDSPPGNMVRLAKRDVGLAHQPVCQIGCRGKATFGKGAHAISAKCQRRRHSRHCRDAELEQVVRLEHRLLVVLHILRISERQALHRDHQCNVGAQDSTGMTAHKLCCVGIALLRHDRTAGRPLVRKRHETKGLRRPDHDLLRHAAQVDRTRRRRR